MIPVVANCSARSFAVTSCRRLSLASGRASSTSCTDAAADAADVPRPFASARVEEVFNKMVKLDREELSTVADVVNERLGLHVSEWDLIGGGGGGRAAVSAAGGGGDDAAAAAAEEKTAFDLKLEAFDAKSKIKIIKEVRSMAGLGLKEAKEMVEGAPKVVMKDIKKEEAEELKAKLEELGATVEIV